MSLAIEIETDYGVPAVYWRISKVSDSFHGTLEVQMAGYASQSAAASNKTPLATHTVYVLTSDPNRANLYPLIKDVAPFIGSENV